MVRHSASMHLPAYLCEFTCNVYIACILQVPAGVDDNNANSTRKNVSADMVDSPGVQQRHTSANTSQPVYDLFPFIAAVRLGGFGGGTTVDENNNLFSRQTQRPLVLSFLNSAIRNSYILTFIAMMVCNLLFNCTKSTPVST